jgi:hypothetical protein
MKDTLRETIQDWMDLTAPQPCIVHYYVGSCEEYAQVFSLHDDYMEVRTQLQHGPVHIAVPYCSIRWVDYHGTTFPPHV